MKPSEFEVQSLAYHNLKSQYPTVRGEFKIKSPELGRLGGRLDIAIFDSHQELKLIIEVKKSKRSHSTKQGERYSQLTGVPCLYLRGIEDAYNARKLVNEFLIQNCIEIH